MHHLLGVSEAPRVEGGRLQPNINAEGIAMLSLGNAAAEALIWRGPMASGAVEKLFAAQWPPLDLLLIDLPPGTGDIPLTVGRKMPISGVLIVTTPSPVALQAVRRGLGLWSKLNVPVLGAVCTMAPYVCACGREHAPFGPLSAVTDAGLPLRAVIPLGSADPAPFDALVAELLQPQNI